MSDVTRRGALWRRLVVASCAAACTHTLLAQAGSTTRVSLGPNMVEGNLDSSLYEGPSVSASGRYVAFHSDATNLVANDTNFYRDVFVRDRQTGQTALISVTAAGVQGNGPSENPCISPDGRYVAFQTRANNLYTPRATPRTQVVVKDRQTGNIELISVAMSGSPALGTSQHAEIAGSDGRFVVYQSNAADLVRNDTNACVDIFVFDRAYRTTTRVSVSASGQQGNAHSTRPAISADGRMVAFESIATNLVDNDTNGFSDIFVANPTGTYIQRVSVGSSGEQGNGDSTDASVSNAGVFVAFTSRASNLVSNDRNGWPDVFLRDRRPFGTTVLLSLSSSASQANNLSAYPKISADGTVVAFTSSATNLVSGDTNGTYDVFLRNWGASTTQRVSIVTGGGQANGWSSLPAISADGHFVAFATIATNLSPDDRNQRQDVYIHQR